MIVAAALVVLILATGTGIVVRRRRSAAAAAVLTPLALPADGAGGLDSFGALVNGAPTAVLEQMPTIPLSLPELEPEPDPEPAQVTLDRRRAELGEFARRDPARTADLLRSLLREEQDA